MTATKQRNITFLFFLQLLIIFFYFYTLYRDDSLIKSNFVLFSFVAVLFLVFVVGEEFTLFIYFTVSVILTNLGILPNVIGAYFSAALFIIGNMLFITVKKKSKPTVNLPNIIRVCFLVFLINMIISTFFSYIRGMLNLGSIIGATSFIIGGFIIYFIYNTVNNAEQLKKLIYIIILVICFSSIIWLFGLINNVYGKTLFMPFRRIGMNEVGVLLGMVTVLSLSLLIFEKNQTRKTLWIISTILIFLGLILVKSRGAWLGVMIAIIFMFLKTKHYKMLFYFGIAAIVISFIQPIKTAFLLRIFQTSLYDPAWLARAIMWETALKIIKHNFLVGIGINNFGLMKYYYGFPIFLDPTNLFSGFKFSYLGPKQLLFGHTHNLYIEMLMNLGIVGFISFICIIIFSIIKLNKIYDRIDDYSLKAITLGLSASLIAYMIHSLLDYLLWIFSSLTIFALFLGMTLVVIKLFESKKLTVNVAVNVIK